MFCIIQAWLNRPVHAFALKITAWNIIRRYVSTSRIAAITLRAVNTHTHVHKFFEYDSYFSILDDRLLLTFCVCFELFHRADGSKFTYRLCSFTTYRCTQTHVYRQAAITRTIACVHYYLSVNHLLLFCAPFAHGHSLLLCVFTFSIVLKWSVARESIHEAKG